MLITPDAILVHNGIVSFGVESILVLVVLGVQLVLQLARPLVAHHRMLLTVVLALSIECIFLLRQQYDTLTLQVFPTGDGIELGINQLGTGAITTLQPTAVQLAGHVVELGLYRFAGGRRRYLGLGRWIHHLSTPTERLLAGCSQWFDITN
uniref:Uncharacterized protein n=1 Tax=Anopheles coluzzii TaxID=1518534 RepID=A0A8W7PJ51_ANOCL